MIVRLNQIEIGYAEQYAGWGARGLQGPIPFAWPPQAKAFEILILDKDENQRPLDPQFRRLQTRQLIPQVVAAMTDGDEHLIVRLDGPLAERELLDAVHFAADPSCCERYAISPVSKFKPEKQGALASVRMLMTPQGWANLCSDARIGLERSVRMRVFAVPLELVNPLLDTSEPDDERWREILPRAGFVMSTVSGLESVYVLIKRLDAGQAKSRLMARLTSANSAGSSNA